MHASFVTILFTDLVGSTAEFDRRGDDAADAWRREQFTAMRRVIADHQGKEVKSTGDGLMVSFASAAAAVQAGVDMQRTAAAGRLRVGIAAGEPLIDGEDLYGTPVIVASRLCNEAGPGEILVTDLVRQVAAPRARLTFRPRGAMRLKGIGEPIAVAEVSWCEDLLHEPEREAPARAISVVIADDLQLLRTGFRAILEAEPDITVVGEAGDGLAAVEMVLRLRPDVVLMDIRMPELNGLDAARRILAEPGVETAVVILTSHDANEYVYEALRIGASGFLVKDGPAERVTDAVRVAAAGDALLAPAITRRLIGRFAESPPGSVQSGIPGRLQELEEAELDMLRLIARGLSNQEIAAQLALAEETVRDEVDRLLGKLGMRDRVQAVVLAYETGFVSSEA